MGWMIIACVMIMMILIVNMIVSSDKGLSFVIAIAMLLWAGLFGNIVNDFAYKNGQVDALTGTIKYEIVEHENMTKTWEEIEED